MIIGSTLIHDGTGTTPFLTPSFPRGGPAAVFSLDVTHLAAAASLTLVVTVEHKNADETTWATAGTFTNITATGTGPASTYINQIKPIRQRVGRARCARPSSAPLRGVRKHTTHLNCRRAAIIHGGGVSAMLAQRVGAANRRPDC